MTRERELRSMVHRHVVACAMEARSDFQDCADTPAGAGLVAIFEMLRQTAWSLGSSLVSNGVAAEPLRTEALAEIGRSFDEGFSKPGEGVML